jgi:hypothetical protein
MLVNILDGADPLDASTDDLRRYVTHLLQHRSPATSAVRYRVTAAVLRLGRPRQPAPVPDLRTLLKACEGRDFLQLRDTALTRRIPEPGGMHRAEVIGLTVASIDLDSDVAVVVGKGRRPRAGSPTAPNRASLDPVPAGPHPAPASDIHRRPVARPERRPDRQRARSDAGAPQRASRHRPHPSTPAAAHRRRHVAHRIRRRRNIGNAAIRLVQPPDATALPRLQRPRQSTRRRPETRHRRQTLDADSQHTARITVLRPYARGDIVGWTCAIQTVACGCAPSVG